MYIFTDMKSDLWYVAKQKSTLSNIYTIEYILYVMIIYTYL